MSKTKRHNPLRIDQRGIEEELGWLEGQWGETITVMRIRSEINRTWRRYQELPSDARLAPLQNALKLAREYVVNPEDNWEYDDV